MKRPNLLFIFSDQHRKFDLTCYGNSEVLTPNLDCLAKEGVRFENCCSNSPVCVPARGTLLTGLYAQKHGAYTNDLEIRYDLESIADVLKQNGYHTGYIGKWHLCGVPRTQYIDEARRLGFEEWKVANCNHHYLSCYYDDEENNRHYVDGYEPEIFGSLAQEFIERNSGKDQPFALFLSFASPHDPHQLVGEEYKEIYKDRDVTLRPNATDQILRKIGTYSTKEQQVESVRGYYGHITAIDKQVGLLIDALKEKGEKDHTLIVYTSDHGDMLGSQGLVDKQLPYEESIGVPLIMSFKDKVEVGVRSQLIGLVDLPVTILSMLGLGFTNPTDGKDLKDMVEKNKSGNSECYLFDMYPCHQAFDKGMHAWRGIRTPRYTYAVYGAGEEWLLFDNEKDPYQKNNLIHDQSMESVKEELHKILADYVNKNDGFMNGEDYIRFSHREEDFDKSQTYFKRPKLEEL